MCIKCEGSVQYLKRTIIHRLTDSLELINFGRLVDTKNRPLIKDIEVLQKTVSAELTAWKVVEEKPAVPKGSVLGIHQAGCKVCGICQNFGGCQRGCRNLGGSRIECRFKEGRLSMNSYWTFWRVGAAYDAYESCACWSESAEKLTGSFVMEFGNTVTAVVQHLEHNAENRLGQQLELPHSTVVVPCRVAFFRLSDLATTSICSLA